MNTKIPDPSQIQPPVSTSLPPTTLSPKHSHQNGSSSPPTNQPQNSKPTQSQNEKKPLDGMEVYIGEASSQRNKSSPTRSKRLIKGGEKPPQQNNKISGDQVSGKQNNATNGEEEALTNANKLPNMSHNLVELNQAKQKLSQIENHSIKLEEQLIKQFKRNKRLKTMYESRFAALSGLLVDQGIALQTIESVLSINDDQNILLADSDNDQLEGKRSLIDDYQNFLNPLQKFYIVSSDQQQESIFESQQVADIENHPEYKSYIKEAVNGELESNNQFESNKTINFNPPKKYEPAVNHFKSKHNLMKQKEAKKLLRVESQDKARDGGLHINGSASGGIFSIKQGKAVKSGRILQKSPSGTMKKYNHSVSMIPSKGAKEPAQRKRTQSKKQLQTPIVGEKKQRGRKSKKVLQQIQLQSQQLSNSAQYLNQNQMQSQTQYQQSITGQQQQIFTMNQVSKKQPPAIVPSTPIQSNLQQPPIIGITPISQINSIIPDQQRNLVESGGLIQPQLSKPYSTNLFASSSQQQLIPNQAKIHSTNFEMASMLQNCILNNDLNNAISNSHLSQDHRKSSNPLQNSFYAYNGQFKNGMQSNQFDLTEEMMGDCNQKMLIQQQETQKSLKQRTSSEVAHINYTINKGSEQKNDSLFNN